MLLSVIIVSYNTAELTCQAVQAVLAELSTTAALKKSSEVIIIDNASQDDSVNRLRRLSKTTDIPVEIICHERNDGFAAANNQGIERSKGEYILLLNSDTIVQPKSLVRLVTAMQDHPVQDLTSVTQSQHGQLDRLGILAASLINPDGSPQAQGGALPTLRSLAAHMLMLDDLPIIGRFLASTQYTGKRAITSDFGSSLYQQGWVGATAVLIRRHVFDEIGVLDASIFMYGEDVEFCLRARKHHWDIAVHPAASIIHYGSASSSSAKALAGELKGYLYIWSKHQPMWQLPLVKILIKIGIMMRVIVFGTMNSPKAQIYRQLSREL